MEKSSKPAREKTWPFLLLILFAVLLWSGAWLFLEHRFPEVGSETTYDAYARRGQFGDMFGAVNSLFTSFAMAAALYTIYLQHKEIRAQRIEQEKSEAARLEQQRLVSEQLSTMQEQLRIAKQTAEHTELPVIEFKSSWPAENETRYKFINKGGRLKILRVGVLNRSTTRVNHTERYIDKGEVGEVRIGVRPKDLVGLKFEVQYKGLFGGEPEAKKFEIKKENGIPVEIEEENPTPAQ